MSQHPRISLVIPTHGRGALLREMLLSLDDQTLPAEEFEVIVVLDGDTDGTWDMLRTVEVSYILKPVYQESAGASVARNHGARMARGDVIAFLDDDMLPGRTFLEEHLRTHAQRPHAVVIGAYVPPPLQTVHPHGGWNVWEARVLTRHYREVSTGRRPPAGRRLYSGNFSVRRTDFWLVGGFDEALERSEDIELGFRLEQAGLEYHFNPVTSSLHRGFRGFRSWCRSAYLYGQMDAMLGQKKRHEVIPEVIRWYHRQPAIARRTLGLCIGRPWLEQALLWALALAGSGLTRLRLYGLAHYGYSGVYKLQYWRGFVEGIGGKEAFKERVAPGGRSIGMRRGEPLAGERGHPGK